MRTGREKTFPTGDNLLLAPAGSKLGIDMKYDVVVIVQHGIDADIGGENIRQQLHAIEDSLASALITFASNGADPERKARRTHQETQW